MNSKESQEMDNKDFKNKKECNLNIGGVCFSVVIIGGCIVSILLFSLSLYIISVVYCSFLCIKKPSAVFYRGLLFRCWFSLGVSERSILQ